MEGNREKVAARSGHWGKDGAVLKGIGKDWRRRYDPKWSPSDVEEQKRVRNFQRYRSEIKPSEQARSTEEPSWICWRNRRGPE
ncbi:uncharacterized protein MONOS_1843 [Monocercomonoides exilis]|uniref:uncharacterized protein n=1 Tax=Monocercomonoides exilis TaxID=2049356 RepID=UPI00355A3546|nr:hypothetical protein MONOS_1843 [Monocercomonoides exilis]|eukprot:MONOS_1843.1-p1 / transcript=MONOS_1843.1 / gene=MONOS_1843 / organism=Monocercomonoides_exilis_PA203 / gene_product=unspecified product / transcript_product=unspecified product / location=Mono_scaffold00035:19086-19334(+) / protein_length=83 / sequence_SO=supercontig / SO=protein_coding / is_pseudo=false